MTSHPKDLGDELVAAVAELPERVRARPPAGAVRLGPGAGGNEARLHGRRYLERVRALRDAVPDVSITTDLIAGFPGESDDEFEATLDLVREAAFDAAFTFVFSPRAGTTAAELPGQVPADVRGERVERLIALTQQQALDSRRAWIGRRAEVLVEGMSRDGRSLRGRTRQNVTVNLSGAVEPGAIVTVDITAATSTTLRGAS